MGNAFRSITNRSLLAFILLPWISPGYSAMGESSGAEKARSVEWVTAAIEAPRLEQRILVSNLLNTAVSYHVYIPEAYDSEPKRSFPVIYWLHGHNATPARIPDVLQYYVQAMQQGHIPPAIIVFPNGMAESMWIDSKDGSVPMESLLVKEVVVDVDKNFRTIRKLEGRLLEGFSMGGYGAARLGAKYPEIFGSVSILGAGPMQREFLADESRNKAVEARKRVLKEVFGDDPGYFREQSPWVLIDLNSDRVSKGIAIRIIVGERDLAVEPNREFSAHLKKYGIRNTLHVVPDVGHNALKLLFALGEENWRFYRAALNGERKPGDLPTGGEPPRAQQGRSGTARHGGFDHERRKRIVERLKTFDKDGDGMIARWEVPSQALSVFRRIDTNHDDKIEPSELGGFLQSSSLIPN